MATMAINQDINLVHNRVMAMNLNERIMVTLLITDIMHMKMIVTHNTDLSIILMHTDISTISQTTLILTQLTKNQVTVATIRPTLFTTVVNHPENCPMTHLIQLIIMSHTLPMVVVDTPIVTILVPIITTTRMTLMVHLQVMPTSTIQRSHLSSLVKMALMTHTSLRTQMSTTTDMEKFLTLTLITRLKDPHTIITTATVRTVLMTSTALPSTVVTVATPSIAARVESVPFMTTMLAVTPRVILPTLISTRVTTTHITDTTTNPKTVTPHTSEQLNKQEWSRFSFPYLNSLETRQTFLMCEKADCLIC